MKKVKLSTLSKEDLVMVRGHYGLIKVEDLFQDLEYYKDEEIHTTRENAASFNAKSILETAIENKCEDMYENWDNEIREDILEEDINQMQIILDRILARNPIRNISYESDKLVEIDVLTKEGEK